MRWPSAFVLIALVACGSDDPTPAIDAALADVDSGADAPSDVVPALELALTVDGEVELLEGGAYLLGGFALVEATTSTTVERVVFYIDDEREAVDDVPPYVLGVRADTLLAGSHAVRVEAVAADGETVDDAVLLAVDRARPEVVFVEPGTATTGAVDGQVDVEVFAQDDTGLREVSLFLNDGPATAWDTPPYTVELDVSGLEVGVHTLEVVAEDLAGSRASDTQLFLICESEQFACAGACVLPGYFDESATHCGACGRTCNLAVETCNSGECVCAGHAELCDERCVDTRIDAAHCGGCGVACGEGEACIDGTCGPSPAGSLRVIPAGTFLMGAPEDRYGAVQLEQPAHEVTITRPFLMDATEVTQGEWERYFSWQPSAAFSCGSDCPVESASWWEALAFANARSEAEGLRPCYSLGSCNDVPVGAGFGCASLFVDAPRQNPILCEGYRLPTEAEWEYAALGGSSEATPAGTLLDRDCEQGRAVDAVAWTLCDGDDGPRPVGQLPANAFGLHDMLGNVNEWTADLYTDFTADAQTDPVFDEWLLGERVFKGGSWNEPLDRIAASTRFSIAPDGQLGTLGFRLVRTIFEEE